jgi:hypothetical protein
MYIAPNYNFLYTRKTKHDNEMSSPKNDKLNQTIQIGMMEVMRYNSATLDQTLEQIATNEFHVIIIINESNLCQFSR